MNTARELREQLAAAGITGAAQEGLVRETASARHKARVERAIEALRELARECGLSEPTDQPAAIAALAAIDAMGVGGPQGVAGDSTQRLPGLHALGKGRKQASDGPAWSAAISDAGQELADSVHAGDGPRDFVEFFVDEDGKLFAVLAGHSVSIDGVNSAWLLTVAREGLRRSLGFAAWHPSQRFARCEPQWWAEAVNRQQAQKDELISAAAGQRIA